MSLDKLLAEASHFFTDRALVQAMTLTKHLCEDHPEEYHAHLKQLILNNGFTPTSRGPDTSVLKTDKVTINLPDRHIALKLHTTPFRHVFSIEELHPDNDGVFKEFDTVYFDRQHPRK